MANVSVTTIPRCHDVAGIRRRAIVGYTGPASYTQSANGGDPTLPSDYGFGFIEDIPEQVVTNGTNFLGVVYVPNTTSPQLGGKFVWYDPSTKAEVGAATNLSTYNGIFEVVGY